MLSTSTLALLAAISGIAFSSLGLSYQWGVRRGIPACATALAVGLGGAAFFACKLGSGADAPAIVWGLGLLAGLGQGGCVLLFVPTLRRGPFSPLWCVMNIGFVPAAIYAVGW